MQLLVLHKLTPIGFQTSCEEVIGPQNPIQKTFSVYLEEKHHRSKLDDSRWLKFLTGDSVGQDGPGSLKGRKPNAFRTPIRSDGQLCRPTAETTFRGVWMYPTKSLGGLGDVWCSMTKTCFFLGIFFVCSLGPNLWKGYQADTLGNHSKGHQWIQLPCPLWFPHTKSSWLSFSLLTYVCENGGWILGLGKLIFGYFVRSSEQECAMYNIYIYRSISF